MKHGNGIVLEVTRKDMLNTFAKLNDGTCKDKFIIGDGRVVAVDGISTVIIG